jgi:hypothetical protein
MQVIIMRYPVLMEDEGRHEFIKGPLDKEEAEQWIRQQEKEYFRPSDYYILEAKNNTSLDDLHER